MNKRIIDEYGHSDPLNLTGKYILIGKKPVPCYDFLKWGKWLEENSRVVKQTRKYGLLVSTVFLGLDHSFDFSKHNPHYLHRPLLFETMVFPLGSCSELDVDRYYTWGEAAAGHKRMCEKVFGENIFKLIWFYITNSSLEKRRAGKYRFWARRNKNPILNWIAKGLSWMKIKQKNLVHF